MEAHFNQNKAGPTKHHTFQRFSRELAPLDSQGMTSGELAIETLLTCTDTVPAQ